MRLCVPHGCRLRATDREADAAIQFGRGVEIADGVHDMIETLRHLTETAPLSD